MPDDYNWAADFFVLEKQREDSRPRVVSVGTPLATEAGFDRGHISYFRDAEVLGTENSPRIGAHAFYASPQGVRAFRSLVTALLQRDLDGGYVVAGRDLLSLPHRFSARIEIDGKGDVPALAIEAACLKLRRLRELLDLHPVLGLTGWPSSNTFRKSFTPYFSGNRSLHLLANGASPVGTGWSEGMKALCNRINAIDARTASQPYKSLVDPAPHTNVRSPWRAMFTPHEKTSLWANRLPWEIVDAGDGEKIVSLCRRPMVDRWAEAAISAMGFDRPPEPLSDALYSRLKYFGELDEFAKHAAEASQLPALRSQRRRGNFDHVAALIDAGFLSAYEGQGPGGVYRLTRCPGCGTTERGKAYMTPGAWITCFRANCCFSDGVGPHGEDGWLNYLGMDAADYNGDASEGCA